MDKLYRINDVLTQLAAEMAVDWNSTEEDEDTTLQGLTMEVARAFGIED